MKNSLSRLVVGLFLLLFIPFSNLSAQFVQMQEVLQKGTYVPMTGEFELYIDSKLDNTYEGDFKLIILEKTKTLYCALIPEFTANTAYMQKKVYGASHSQVVFFAVDKNQATRTCKDDLEVKTYLSSGNSLNSVWRVMVKLKFCHKGKGYSITHKSWE